MTETTDDGNISLADVLTFWKEYCKAILGFGIAGGLASAGFLAVAPPQYEANALIEMAQIRSLGPNGTVALSSIESHALLMERLKNPSTYDPEAIQSCTSDISRSSGESMVGLVKTSTPKNVSAVVELRVRRDSPALAEQCARGVFEMVRRQQGKLMESYYSELRDTLNSLQARFNESRIYVTQAEEADLRGISYLARRDELMYLVQQIDHLQRTLARDVSARLISPVYASPAQVWPPRGSTLALGVMSGLLLGLMFAFGHRMISQRHS